MNSRPFLKYYILIITLLITTCLACFLIFRTSSLTDLIIFIMTVISVWIAILAYHISIKTYVSIDAVNAISRMDGNVMENEGYRTNIAAHIRRFNATDKDQLCTDLLEYIKTLFNHSHNISGAKLADNIQEVIDIIVLLPFIINSSDKNYASQNISKIDSLISDIHKKISSFEKISEGSCILMKESLKLIEAVFAYQKIKPLKTSSNYTLMDVRGTMLKNAVSKTVYYNYMGLLYLTKATETILQHINITTHHTNIYQINTLTQIKNCKASCFPELSTSHLETAIGHFRTASEIIKGDVMWNAFISFNIGRAEFLLYLISDGTKHTDWAKTMNSAINYRKQLNLILSDILNDDSKVSFFQRAFIGEEHKARILKVIFEIVADNDITNILGQTIYPKSNYVDFLSSEYIQHLPDDEFNLFYHHIEDISQNYTNKNLGIKKAL